MGVKTLNILRNDKPPNHFFEDLSEMRYLKENYA